MFNQLYNWRTLLAILAIGIVTATIFYSRYVAGKISVEERARVTAFGESLRIKASTNDPMVLNFTNQLTIENRDIPIVETDEKGRPTGLYVNLDSAAVTKDSNYLISMVKKFSRIHDPVVVEITRQPSITYNKYYYGESGLQNEVRYYPLVQLLVVGLFIAITILSLRSSYRSQQNLLWAGMAKESAHQMGTPLSSMTAWVEMLRENPANTALVVEMEKDLKRLQLVSDRFSKIGSIPQMERSDLVEQVVHMVDYMKIRAGGKISFSVHPTPVSIMASVSVTLFDWVIENLIKNALDAMEGKGAIHIDMQETAHEVVIDVSDNGKGIAKAHLASVFNAGFTTKKRGWGLGLTLCKRIIEEYHHGRLFVKWSEPGKGTTFRIILKKQDF